MKIAYSPCPNDTFLFDAWVHGKIASPITPEPVLADIQQLNSWAIAAMYPVTKVSTYMLGKITSDYSMLKTGAAICHAGPKIIAKKPFDLVDLPKMRLAIPGKETTAYLLLRTLCPAPKSILECRYDEIPHLLQIDACDAGLIIHETRFTFEAMGFTEIADLGTLFHERFGCPVPLGVVVARRDLASHIRKKIEEAMQESLAYARKNPLSSREYVLKMSQEKDASVVFEHIKTYVTDETYEVSKQGLESIKILFELAISQNLLEPKALNFYEADHLCYR